jgi:hypothetical protein
VLEAQKTGCMHALPAKHHELLISQRIRGIVCPAEHSEELLVAQAAVVASHSRPLGAPNKVRHSCCRPCSSPPGCRKCVVLDKCTSRSADMNLDQPKAPANLQGAAAMRASGQEVQHCIGWHECQQHYKNNMVCSGCIIHGIGMSQLHVTPTREVGNSQLVS